MTDAAGAMAAGVTGIILAGGKGTRLAGLYPGLPKPMIPARGRPFVDWVMAAFAGVGVRRFVVSVGHLAEVAEAHVAGLAREGWSGLRGARVSTIREDEPLGTGGGVRLAWDRSAAGADILVSNGDSLALASYAGLWELASREDVDGVVVAVRVPDVARYGTLEVDGEGMVRGFLEKREELAGKPGLINAGVYVLKGRVRRDFPDVGAASIERDVFPGMLKGGRRLAVLAVDGPFLDIGTPESVREAEGFLSGAAARGVLGV